MSHDFDPVPWVPLVWSGILLLMLWPLRYVWQELRANPQLPLRAIGIRVLQEHPILIFAAGVIIGHIMWRG